MVTARDVPDLRRIGVGAHLVVYASEVGGHDALPVRTEYRVAGPVVELLHPVAARDLPNLCRLLVTGGQDELSVRAERRRRGTGTADRLDTRFGKPDAGVQALQLPAAGGVPHDRAAEACGDGQLAVPTEARVQDLVGPTTQNVEGMSAGDLPEPGRRALAAGDGKLAVRTERERAARGDEAVGIPA